MSKYSTEEEAITSDKALSKETPGAEFRVYNVNPQNKRSLVATVTCDPRTEDV